MPLLALLSLVVHRRRRVRLEYLVLRVCRSLDEGEGDARHDQSQHGGIKVRRRDNEPPNAGAAGLAPACDEDGGAVGVSQLHDPHQHPSQN